MTAPPLSTTISGVKYLVKEVAGMSGDIQSDSESHTLVFDAWRADGAEPSLATLYQAVSTLAPSTFAGLPAQSVRYSEDEGTCHYIFQVTYNREPAESAIRWSFDTTGGTIKMTTSKNTTRYAPSGRTAPDFQGAIGVKNTGKDAEPEGVDIVTPGLKLTATYKFAKNTISFSDVKTWASVTGRTNNAAFYTFAQGELLFLGATGEVVPGVPNEIQFHFLASSNATGLSVGSISSIAKKGHEYLWVAFEASEDTSAKKLVQRPLGVYIERVYDEGDFSTLGIGTS